MMNNYTPLPADFICNTFCIEKQKYPYSGRLIKLIQQFCNKHNFPFEERKYSNPILKNLYWGDDNLLPLMGIPCNCKAVVEPEEYYERCVYGDDKEGFELLYKQVQEFLNKAEEEIQKQNKNFQNVKIEINPKTLGR